MTTVKAHSYDTGLSLLKKVGGDDFAAPLNSLKEVAPDLARMTVEFCYGEIMSRPALDLPTRQLCTVAALSAMANAQPQLRYHIAGALNVGCAPADIVETIMLTAVFAGFPAAGNALLAAREVFSAQQLSFTPQPVASDDDRYSRGYAALEAISASAGKAVTQSLMDVAPDMARFVIEFSYGDVLSRPLLDNRTKELAVVAMLTAMGTAAPQLSVHIAAAFHVGATETEISEVIQQMAIYAGFPAALNGLFAAKAHFKGKTDAAS